MLSEIIKNVDSIIIYDDAVRAYLTNFKSSFGVYIYLKDKSYFITDSRYVQSAKKSVKNADVVLYTENIINLLIEKHHINKIGLMLNLDSAKTYIDYINKNIEVVDITDNIFKIIAVKDEKAIKNIKKACNIAEKAFKFAITEIKAGITEKQLSSIIERNILKFGGDGKAFDTIVAFGKNSSVPHHQTGNTKLKQNMPILIDFGARFNGFCSDMTRTFYFGSPTKEFSEVYYQVLLAHNTAKLNIKANMLGKEADSIARNVLEKCGYGKFFTHSLGHGIGINIHEYPYLNKKSEDLLTDNMVFSIEPGVYLENKFGVRIEDTVTLNGGVVKSFMSSTKELFYIENNKFKVAFSNQFKEN